MIYNSYYLYIIICENDNYYIGITTDPIKCFKQHKKGVFKYTRANRPLRMRIFGKIDKLGYSPHIKREFLSLSRREKRRLFRNAIPLESHKWENISGIIT